MVTFRDFAAAIMRNDVPAAGEVLQTLLALAPDQAQQAAQHFQSQAATQGPAFMGKAMGLRTAVASGNDAEIAALLDDCFGLEGSPRDAAVAAVKRGSST